jgi:hypothetical protein
MMKRDTLKTLAGLLIIGVIVVATFMYGNAQRQAQIKRDEAAKKQQQQQANANEAGKATASPSGTTTPTASPTTQPTTGGTAAVQSPSSSSVQGSATSTPTPAATPGTVAGAAATPAPAGTAPLPDTGPEVIGVLGSAAVLGSVLYLRRSKKSLYAAVRSPRQ